MLAAICCANFKQANRRLLLRSGADPCWRHGPAYGSGTTAGRAAREIHKSCHRALHVHTAWRDSPSSDSSDSPPGGKHRPSFRSTGCSHRCAESGRQPLACCEDRECTPPSSRQSSAADRHYKSGGSASRSKLSRRTISFNAGVSSASTSSLTPSSSSSFISFSNSTRPAAAPAGFWFWFCLSCRISELPMQEAEKGFATLSTEPEEGVSI